MLDANRDGRAVQVQLIIPAVDGVPVQRTLIANSGSADEVRACLKVAIGWGYLTDEVVTEPMALVDRELRLLWGLMNKRA